MKIAVVSSHTAGHIDELLSKVAAKLQAEGLLLSGVIKVLENQIEGEHYCDMDLRVLPAGPEIRITQSLGGGAEGCRLDSSAIMEAVAATEKNNQANVDLFILNKFGPQEAEGRGFCDAIAVALEHGTPVLVGVGNCRDAFDTFVDGAAEELPADEAAIYDWCKAAIAENEQA